MGWANQSVTPRRGAHVVDILAKFASGDVSGLVAILLVALFFILRFIAKEFFQRLAKAERAIKRLKGYRQNHVARLAYIEDKVGLETIEYKPEDEDDE